jgi:hypothetical protein
MAKSSGSAFLGNYHYYLSLEGQEGIDKILAALAEEDRIIFAKKILNIHWLDAHAVFRFYNTADKVLGNGDGKLIYQASNHAAHEHLGGIYKIFIPSLSPWVIIKNGSKVWRRYYDQGHMTAEKVSKQKLKVILTDWPDIPVNHECSIGGYYEGVMEIMKKKEFKVEHTQCVLQGAKSCEWEISWKN